MARWSDYVFATGGEVPAMWAEAAAGRRTLYVLGEGFDPRMLVGLRRAIDSGGMPELSVLSLGLAEPGGTSSRARQADENRQELLALLSGTGLTHTRIPYPTVHERRALSRALLKTVVADPAFQAAEHVIVDISALPVGVYFGLIKGLLDLCTAGKFDGELQVVVAENVAIDSQIEGSGVDNPAPVLGFGFGVPLDPAPDRALLVWAPILGEGAIPQLEALADRLIPDEICPVLPFPARNPRRADDLLLSMRAVLLDRLEVEPSNYIYADERNPFDLYRALGRLHARYRSALKPLGDASVVLSLHSSKTLSLGALLAAYEHRLPALNAEPEHYDFASEGLTEQLIERSELSCLWLVGVPTK